VDLWRARSFYPFSFLPLMLGAVPWHDRKEDFPPRMSTPADHLRKIEHALKAGNPHPPALKSLIEALRQQIIAPSGARTLQ
jgi:hypothetical protein